MKKNHISIGEVDNFMMADDNEDFFKMQKQVWDAKKKNFKKILVNAKGENIGDSGEKLKVIKTKMKKLGGIYNKWKKSNSFKIGQAGTEENNEVTQKAKTMFRDRKIHKFRPFTQRNQSTGKDKTHNNKYEDQLLSKEQLLKVKKRKEIVKLKNLPRDVKKRLRDNKNGKTDNRSKGRKSK